MNNLFESVKAYFGLKSVEVEMTEELHIAGLEKYRLVKRICKDQHDLEYYEARIRYLETELES